jgi:hypothetical protein
MYHILTLQENISNNVVVDNEAVINYQVFFYFINACQSLPLCLRIRQTHLKSFNWDYSQRYLLYRFASSSSSLIKLTTKKFPASIYGFWLHLLVSSNISADNISLFSGVDIFRTKAERTLIYWTSVHSPQNRIGGVIVSVLASSAVDRGFEPRSSQTKDYKIGMCCFSAKHAALRKKSKDWLARNQNNVSEYLFVL